MRPVLALDVVSAARALLAMPEAARQERCREMFVQADAADRFVRRLGRLHPVWGNGTLLAAARQWPLAGERSFDDAAYRACTMVVLRQIEQRAGAGLCKLE